MRVIKTDTAIQRGGGQPAVAGEIKAVDTAAEVPILGQKGTVRDVEDADALRAQGHNQEAREVESQAFMN